jgi:hypothetical protein
MSSADTTKIELATSIVHRIATNAPRWLLGVEESVRFAAEQRFSVLQSILVDDLLPEGHTVDPMRIAQDCLASLPKDELVPGFKLELEVLRRLTDEVQEAFNDGAQHIRKIAQRMAETYLSARSMNRVTASDLAHQRVRAYADTLCILTADPLDVRDEEDQIRDLLNVLHEAHTTYQDRGLSAMTSLVVDFLKEVHETRE